MTPRGIALAGVVSLLLAACSASGGTDDVPPLPEESADSANALMAEAERAAGNAAIRAETGAAPARSAPTITKR